MEKDDLRFLLKDKYKLPESKIQELATVPLNQLPANILVDVKLLQSGQPLAYIIGHVDFLDTHIDLSYRPLIPRPETEYWVGKILEDEANLHSKESLEILDIFCGSGCIGTVLLNHLGTTTHVTFADIDERCINQTLKNTELLMMQKPSVTPTQIEIIKSDVWDSFDDQKFDFIFANPPYIGIRDRVGEEIFYEPSMALFAGSRGLDLIDKFLLDAGDHLKPGGKIFMEFGAEQKRDVDGILQQLGYTDWCFHKDQFERWRYVTL